MKRLLLKIAGALSIAMFLSSDTEAQPNCIPDCHHYQNACYDNIGTSFGTDNCVLEWDNCIYCAWTCRLVSENYVIAAGGCIQ